MLKAVAPFGRLIGQAREPEPGCFVFAIGLEHFQQQCPRLGLLPRTGSRNSLGQQLISSHNALPYF